MLRELVAERPDASLRELADAAVERLGGSVKSTTVWRALRRLGFERVRPERVPTPSPPQDGHRYRDVHRRPGTATAYPTNLTDAEWEVLEPLFDGRFPTGQRPIYPDRLVLDAMLYVVRTGCAWRMLPKDFPPWKAVYGRFRRWSDWSCPAGWGIRGPRAPSDWRSVTREEPTASPSGRACSPA